MREAALTTTEIRRKARHGLAIYFAVLVPLSAVVSAIAIAKGSVNWAIPAMALPALASVVARRPREYEQRVVGFFDLALLGKE